MEKTIAELIEEIFSDDPYRLVVSKPVKKDQEIKKVNLVLKKDFWQMEEYTQTQVFHTNMAESQAMEKTVGLLQGDFLQLNAWSDANEHQIMISKKGKVSCKKKQLVKEGAKPGRLSDHNRKKKYLLEEGTIIPPLVDMGIFTKEGKVVSSMQDKYRQINRFVEIVDDTVKNLDRTSLTIIDFGCGKSYLTFILYYYFTQIRHLTVDMTGLDLKEKVIENCNAAARKYGYDGLHFEMGDINGYKTEKPADMVITLHACDTATDYALYHAICWNAGMIFSVPCCQHELNGQFESKELSLLSRYGIIRERTSALMTDAIRANLLEYMGYKTQVMEFVELENTPKNLLIRAVRRDYLKKEGQAVKMRGGADKNRQAYLKEVENLMEAFHLEPTLYKLIKEGGKEELK